MAALAEVFVEVKANLGKLKPGLDKGVKASKFAALKMAKAFGPGGMMFAALGKLKRFFGNVFSSLIKWTNRLGIALVGVSVIAIKFASDAEQTWSRFNIVMGEGAKEARKFTKALADGVGRAEVKIGDSVATFMSFFKGLEFADKDSITLSKTLTQLSLDFASFNNIADDEALQRFISALSGSGEVLDRFGINIKQGALDQELLARGFPKVTKGATEQQKAVARLGIIMRAMTDQGAIGNAIETNKEFANQMKKLKGEVQELFIAIGKELLPAAGRLVGVFNQIVHWAKGEVGPALELLKTKAFEVRNAFNEMFGTEFGIQGSSVIVELIIAMESLRIHMKMSLDGIIGDLRHWVDMLKDLVGPIMKLYDATRIVPRFLASKLGIGLGEDVSTPKSRADEVKRKLEGKRQLDALDDLRKTLTELFVRKGIIRPPSARGDTPSRGGVLARLGGVDVKTPFEMPDLGAFGGVGGVGGAKKPGEFRQVDLSKIDVTGGGRARVDEQQGFRSWRVQLAADAKIMVEALKKLVNDPPPTVLQFEETR